VQFVNDHIRSVDMVWLARTDALKRAVPGRERSGSVVIPWYA
jgi:hypothetical protein